MERSTSIAAISKAIVSVMKEVVGIDKNMTVGSGNSSYKGVSDKDVKHIIGNAMEKHGLCMLPVDVEPTHQIDRWIENTGYGDKQKQQVFTAVKTKYLLLHESGEFIEVMGYGHGVDSQDKAAGKATTYALKYALLYTFMVPTGKIDDADAERSDEKETPPPPPPPANELPWLNENMPQYKSAVDKIKAGKSTVEALEKYFRLSKAIKTKINEEVKKQDPLTNQQNAA